MPSCAGSGSDEKKKYLLLYGYLYVTGAGAVEQAHMNKGSLSIFLSYGDSDPTIKRLRYHARLTPIPRCSA